MHFKNPVNKIFLLCLALFLLASCNNEGDEGGKKTLGNYLDTTYAPQNEAPPFRPVLKAYLKDPVMAHIDSIAGALDTVSHYEKYQSRHEHAYFKRVLVYYKDNQAYKLEVTYISNGKVVSDTDRIYFLNNGRFITYRAKDELFYYDSSRTETRYEIYKGLDTVQVISSDIQDGHRAYADFAYDLATDMQYFPNIFYNQPIVLASDSFIIQTAEKIYLYRNYSDLSRDSTLLPIGTSLLYLGNTRNPYAYKGRQWIWLKVKTMKGRIGWVFGNMDFIFPGEYDDC